MDLPWNVVFRGVNHAQLKTILANAKKKNVLQEVLDAIDQIVRALGNDPRSFGEPKYRLRHLELEIFFRAVRPLYVTYGVHDFLPMVIIQKIGATPELEADAT